MNLKLLILICSIAFIASCKKDEISDKKEISSFKFLASDNAVLSEDITGIISGNEIQITAIGLTNINSLVASFNYSGKNVLVGNVKQISNISANDFSKPLIYCVTADDGSKQEYIVSVYNEELSFSIDNVLVNPFNRSALTATIEISADRPFSIQTRVIGLDGKGSDITFSNDTLKSQHQIPIFGLYFSTDYKNSGWNGNKVEVILKGEKTRFYIDTLSIETIARPSWFPDLVTTGSAMNDGALFAFLYNKWGHGNQISAMVTDRYGKFRGFWYIENEEENLFPLSFIENGNIVYSVPTRNTIYETDFLGKIINSWILPVEFVGSHHEICEIPSGPSKGNFLVTVSQTDSRVPNDPTNRRFVEDHIIEIERTTGKLLTTWNLRESLQVDRSIMPTYVRNMTLNLLEFDWCHNNGLAFDPTDNTLIISTFHHGFAKLDWSNNLKWILAPHGGWTVNGKGEELGKYMLNAIDLQGQVYPDSVQLGFKSLPGFEWPWVNHSPSVRNQDGKLVLTCMINGASKNFKVIPFFEISSWGAEYIINEKEMTVKQGWTYGRDKGAAYFSVTAGQATRLKEGNYLLTFGSIGSAFLGNFFFGGDERGIVVEVENNNQPVWQMTALESERADWRIYRTQKFMFPKL
jgi:arylsulfate sulfotransferase